MTDPLTLAVAALTLGLALVTGWLHLPRVPELDGERWFKLMLATLLRGSVEAKDGDVAAWERSVVRFVPYHPAGRWPERKIEDPVLAPGPSAPGERPLVEALAALPRGRRWEHLYDTDPVGIEARLADPLDLGPAYDLARVVGADWDALAAWGAGDPAFGTALRRRLPLRWVLVRGSATPLDLVGALRDELEDAIEVPWDADRGLDAGVAAVVAAMKGATPDPADRLVLVGEAEGALLVLKALRGEPMLRDRVLGVVAVGGLLAGRPEEGSFGEPAVRDWMEAHFGHDALDTEMMRATPYASVLWLDRSADPPGIVGLPLALQRFPPPRGEPGASSVETVDLGPLPTDPELPLPLVARALWAWTVAWIATRQG